ncbi:hypothetical protein ACF3NX_13150 (plasmid) [Acetobacter orientalis]|uniref:hypothetical protein n=1 Tax=Acetobacter orientalis TaxID=146474 RepID=UPI00386C1FAA
MLISQDVCIIPVGISCIHGFQLRRGLPLIENSFNIKLTETSSFFRWIYQSPAFIGNFFDLYVNKENSITIDDVDIYKDFFFLPKTESWFMHDALKHFESDKDNGFKTEYQQLLDIIDKYNYLIKKLRNLSSIRKRIFIFGNSDLGPREWPFYREGLIEWYFNKKNIEDLCNNINKSYPNGDNIFIYVTNKRNIIKDLDCCYIYVNKDVSGFFDDNESWDVIFNDLSKLTKDKSIICSRNKKYLENFKTRENIFDASCEEIKINNNEVVRNKNYLEIDSLGGIPIWGPYIRLCSGLYEVTVEFVENSLQGKALFSISHNFGENSIIEVPIDSKHLKLDHILKVRFSVGDDLHQVETRIKALSNFKAKIKKISIRNI